MFVKGTKNKQQTSKLLGAIKRMLKVTTSERHSKYTLNYNKKYCFLKNIFKEMFGVDHPPSLPQIVQLSQCVIFREEST